MELVEKGTVNGASSEITSTENGKTSEEDPSLDDRTRSFNEDEEGKMNFFQRRLSKRRLSRKLSKRSTTAVRQGHLKIKEDGQKVYKKTPSQAIMSATQLGIGFSVGRLGATPERDVLMVDFYFTEKVWFPSGGTKETPSHKHDDFKFKTYAPIAFRYFRDLFGIQPSDFMLSLANEPLREISNPGASGSLFFISNDDMFIIKTVQHKEATFLQQLLPGYYMNIHQNPRTLLPKFFGLYCYQSAKINIRLTVMNNILPSKFKCHKKYDLKGSTYKRKASKKEQEKKTPCFKDLDFMEHFPEGITLEAEVYDTIIKIISRDVRVLESFSLMDYSFLLCIHNIDEAERDKVEKIVNSPAAPLWKGTPDREARRSMFVQALEAIPQSSTEDTSNLLGGIPARNDQGERLILFMGIIDILQNYRLSKKMEHGFKSLLTDGDTVSVHNPTFYGKRFLDFIKDKVFRRAAFQRRNTRRRSFNNENKPGLSSSLSSSNRVKIDDPNSEARTVRMDGANSSDALPVDLSVIELSLRNESVGDKNEEDIDTYNGDAVESSPRTPRVTIDEPFKDVETTGNGSF